MLLLWRQCGIQRNDFNVSHFGSKVIHFPFDPFAGLINFLQDQIEISHQMPRKTKPGSPEDQRRPYLLSGEKEEDVTFVFLAHVDLYDRTYGCLKVVPLWLGGVEDLDGVGATGDGQEGTVVEVNLEFPGV